MKKVISLLLVVVLLCSMAPVVTVHAEASLSYTDLLLDINWTNIDHVGRQTPYSYSCSCFALAYSRTILDNTVHYFYEYNEYGNTEYSVNALWYVGQHNSAVYSSSNEVFRKLYWDLCSGKPVIVYVTGRGSSGHYITVVGFQSISSLENLSEYNFLIIDPVFNDGHVAVNMGGVGYSLNSYRQVVYDQSSARVTFSATNNLACSHNYTFTDTPANCTQNGLREYTCSSCGDTYSEPIEALGHNYIGFKTDATCDTAGYTTYTCTRCSDSYVKVADGWSEWSAEYPADVPENLIEQKTQYSALEKEYTTSTSDTLDGWTNIGTTLSDWGAVQTTTTKPTETDTLRITNTTQTGWGYYHWCSYYNWTYCIDSIQVNGATQVEWHGYTSSFELPAYTIADQGGQQSYGGNGNGAAACPRNFYVWFRNYDADVYTYSYQTREKLNQFYRWSNEWSDWSDTEIQSSEDLQVKTQTVYRYYTGKLADHKYSYTVTEEPSITAEGLLVGTCSVCGATTTMSLPKLNTADYTYAVKTDATCTADGIATYTWKTTTYGNFSFNVTLSKIAHSYDKGQVTVTATCTQNGIKTYTCSDCGDVYTENIAPIGHQYQYGVCITCGVEDPNVTALSGTITSFGSSSEPVTMGIYAKNADTALRTLTVKNGSFMIMGLPVGEYVLSFSKQNHVTREYTVTLEGGETVVDAKICLIGDVTGDGEVNMGDISRLYAHIRNTTPLVDEYQLLCANVNGDDSVNMGDISAIYSHVKGTKKLY